MPRKVFKHGPEELQMILFFDYCRSMAHVKPHYRLAYHIPNERKASVQRRITMARAGVKKGIPDICVPVANDKYHSLYIEMKVKPNKPSLEQLELIESLKAAGSYAVLCWSGSEAMMVLDNYIANKL